MFSKLSRVFLCIYMSNWVLNRKWSLLLDWKWSLLLYAGKHTVIDTAFSSVPRGCPPSPVVIVVNNPTYNKIQPRCGLVNRRSKYNDRGLFCYMSRLSLGLSTLELHLLWKLFIQIFYFCLFDTFYFIFNNFLHFSFYLLQKNENLNLIFVVKNLLKFIEMIIYVLKSE